MSPYIILTTHRVGLELLTHNIMAFKKFGDIVYPIPGIDTAMQVLRPGARWDANNSSLIEFEDDEGREPPTIEELQEEVKREYSLYKKYEYERNREKEYPDVISQLDMLYHDIKNNNLENGSWIEKIESVKNKYPKPD